MTSSANSFDIVVLPFPSSDSPNGLTLRPALVLSTTKHRRTGQVTVALITSSENALAGDVTIANWQDVGLPKPSKVRTAKLATLDASAIERRLGTLDQDARVEVKACLREFLDF